MQVAYFAAGCFWGVEETFRHIRGVVKTVVGYMGGDSPNPTYEKVCNGNTGHAETVKVIFDGSQTTFAELLNGFWDCHDPSQLNRQGPDIGNQYRSAIFYVSDEQRTQAEKAIIELNQTQRFSGPIQTRLEPAQRFYRAEEYHQHYIAKKSCQF